MWNFSSKQQFEFILEFVLFHLPNYFYKAILFLFWYKNKINFAVWIFLNLLLSDTWDLLKIDKPKKETTQDYKLYYLGFVFVFLHIWNPIFNVRQTNQKRKI